MRDLKTINVVDIEATCYGNNDPDRNIYPGEIIEIGILEVDVETLAIQKPLSLIVKPTYEKINDFCTSINHITQERVDSEGIEFKKACAHLESAYNTRDRFWVSWGDYDRKMFVKQCARERIRYPFSNQHINIKAVFSTIMGLNERAGVERALEILGMEFVGTPHKGDDDALNIARILVNIYGTFRKKDG